MNFGERLVSYRENTLKLNQKDMADKMGIAPQTLVRYEKNKIKPSYEFIEKLTNLFSDDINWLLTGKNKQANTNNLRSIDNPDTYKIDVLSVKASAGAVNYHYHTEVTHQLDLDIGLFKTKPNLTNINIIEVDGDSMYPTLSNGDFVVVDKGIHRFTDDIYVVNYGGGLKVKRLQFRLDGTIKIISDNKMYDDEIYNPNENQEFFEIVGKVIMQIKR